MSNVLISTPDFNVVVEECSVNRPGEENKFLAEPIGVMVALLSSMWALNRLPAGKANPRG